MSPLRLAPVLALLIVGCARGDAPKSTATPPAQLPAASAATEAPPPPPPGLVASGAPATQGSASASPVLRDEAKADAKKTKGSDTDAVRRAPAATATATATVQKPKCNCAPGDPTCNC